MTTPVTQHAVSFTVLGIAAAKGNMKAFPFKRRDGSLGAAVTEGTKSAKGWADAVRSAAQQQCGGVFFDGAIRVAMVFFLPRPQSLPKRVTTHTKKPDCSKLARNAEDALTGVLWKDDAQITELIVRKAYAVTRPHVRILVDHAAAIEEVALTPNLFDVTPDVEPILTRSES